MPDLPLGLIPASHTPFHADGTLNLAPVEAQARLYLESGLKAVFIGGTTGEFASLTLDERQRLTNRWLDVAGDSLQIAVHAGSNSQPDAIALATHAREAGAAAVAAMAPSYFKPRTIADLVEFCVPIAAAADPLPFYYYDIPGMTGVRFPMSDFLHEARHRIPTLRGLKYSNDDMPELQGCLQRSPGKFDVFFGSDESLLAALALGVKAAVGATYNFCAPHFHQLIAAFDKGDFATARTLQFQHVEVVKILAAYGFVPASKVVMNLMGIDLGPVRTPLKNLTPAQVDELAARLSEFTIFPRPLTLRA
jgi:N-acetylneuraminate lyase